MFLYSCLYKSLWTLCDILLPSVIRFYCFAWERESRRFSTFLHNHSCMSIQSIQDNGKKLHHLDIVLGELLASWYVLFLLLTSKFSSTGSKDFDSWCVAEPRRVALSYSRSAPLHYLRFVYTRSRILILILKITCLKDMPSSILPLLNGNSLVLLLVWFYGCCLSWIWLCQIQVDNNLVEFFFIKSEPKENLDESNNWLKNFGLYFGIKIIIFLH